MAARFWPAAAPRAAPASASDAPAAPGLPLAMADPSPQPFPKSARLRAAPEFQAVFKAGLKHSGVFFRLYFLSGATPARLGLSVPKKAVPQSVSRNRLKACAAKVSVAVRKSRVIMYWSPSPVPVMPAMPLSVPSCNSYFHRLQHRRPCKTGARHPNTVKLAPCPAAC